MRVSINFKNGIFYLAVLTLLFLTPFSRKYIPLAESNTYGTVVAILVIAFFYSKQLYRVKINIKLFTVMLLGVYYSVLVLFYGVQSYANLNVNKFFISIILFFIFVFSSKLFIIILDRVDNKVFNNSINYAFIILIADGLISSFVHIFIRFDKDFLLFVEPSHFAIVSLPFLLYKIVSSKKQKSTLYFFIFFCIGIAMESLTLLAGLLLIMLIVLGKKYSILLLAGVFILFINYTSTPKFEYYESRINYANPENPSLLVFLSGWEEAYRAIVKTNGLGVGFQQSGYVKLAGEYRLILASMGKENQNIYDNGVLGAKLILENGVVGVVLLFMYLYQFLKILFRINFTPSPSKSNKGFFFISIFLMFSVEFLLKGSGYFSQTTFLFLTSLFFLLPRQNLYPYTKMKA